MSSPAQVETAGQVTQTSQLEPAVPAVDPNAVKAALMLDAPDGCRSRMYVGSKVFAIKSQLAGEIILCDNGSSISCITSTDGRLPGTGSQEDAGPLTIGDTSSSLRSEGTHWHAMELRSDNGQSEDSLLHMHFTPNSIANIRSETQEVEQRGSRIEQVPGQPRKWHTIKGRVYHCVWGRMAWAS